MNKSAIAICVLLLAIAGGLWHYQSAADTQRLAIRTKVEHENHLVSQMNDSLQAVSDAVGPVSSDMNAAVDLQKQRHTEVMSDSPDVETVKSLTSQEQAKYDDLSTTSGTLLANLRTLINASEAAGTNFDTRDLRAQFDDISSNFLSGEEACSTAIRMISDNIREYEQYGVFAAGGENSSSDVQHSYDDCGDRLTKAATLTVSFHDSAAQQRDALAEKLHETQAQYGTIHGPLDWMIPPPPLPSAADTSQPSSGS